MIQITFSAPLSDIGDFISVKDGPCLLKKWPKAYSLEKGIVFLEDDWDFRFVETECGDIYVFIKKNDLDVMIMAKRVQTVKKYELVMCDPVTNI